MGQYFRQGSGLSQEQVKTFKLSVSAACRMMSADQILDIADQLHDIIRKRGASCGSFEVTTQKVAAYDPCTGATGGARELAQ